MSRDLQILAGIAAIVVGFWLLHQAFDAQGRNRPFWLHFVPGL